MSNTTTVGRNDDTSSNETESTCKRNHSFGESSDESTNDETKALEKHLQPQGDNVRQDTNDFGPYYATPQRDNSTTSFTPTAPDNAPTVLSFSNLIVTTKTEPPKILLNNVSGNIIGGLWAIMGASGSGKSTLLSTLSLRIDNRYVDIKGDFRLNGRRYSRDVLKTMSGYLMQDDLLFAELTVQETLYYAAELRMLSITKSKIERCNRIDEVLQLLEITHCRNTIIGNTRRKGISGGERKRVCVAIEMLNHPKLLFMDGPTTGLDSTTAFTICKVFKKMTDKGECTMVCSMEQPSPRVFRLFDNLILMKHGEIFYIGHSMKSIRFLITIGHPCPIDCNLADHLIHVITDPTTTTTIENKVPIDLSLGSDKPPFFTRIGIGNWFHQFYILLQRCFTYYIRQTDIILFNFIATIIMAIFISCSFWFQIGTNQSSIPSILPPLFFVVVNQGVVGSIQTVTSFPRERAIMLRERASGSYQTSSYFMAKTICDFITGMWTPIVLACIVYFAIGYAMNAGEFFIYVIVLILTAIAAMSLSTAGK